jgi:hypothetical protein
MKSTSPTSDRLALLETPLLEEALDPRAQFDAVDGDHAPDEVRLLLDGLGLGGDRDHARRRHLALGRRGRGRFAAGECQHECRAEYRDLERPNGCRGRRRET